MSPGEQLVLEYEERYNQAEFSVERTKRMGSEPTSVQRQTLVEAVAALAAVRHAVSVLVAEGAGRGDA